MPGYAYLTTTRPGEEIIIIDLDTMTQVGYYDAPGSVSGESVFVKDGIGYLVHGGNLQLFDAGSPSGSRTSLGSIALAGDGTNVQVVGQYAYVSISSTTTQLQIIDISDPNAPAIVNNYSVSGLEARNLFVNELGDRIYLVTAWSSTQDEFFIINSSDTNKTNLSIIASGNTGDMNPNAIGAVLDDNRIIIVGEGGDEYQVWSVANENLPSICGSLGSLGGIYDLATVIQDNGDTYAYITTGQSASELKIIEGGGGDSYQTHGTYESALFDAGQATAFNRLVTERQLPASTTLQFQVAVASPADGNCDTASYTFVGPDGTNSTYYESEGAFPFDSVEADYSNPGQCLKYKAYLETDNIEVSPYFESILVNYSP